MLAQQQHPSRPPAAAPIWHASSKSSFVRHASSSCSACSRRSLRRCAGVSAQASLFGGLFGGLQAPSGSSSKLVERPSYNKREVVRLGSLEVSPMGLGTWAWGNQLLWGYQPEMDAELQEVFNAVVAAGVNIFDTADSYGTGALNGRSEQLLGQFITEYPGSANVRDNLHVATKFAAYPWRVTPRNIVAACRGSLRRTGLAQISLGQLHWSTAKYAPLQEWALWNGLADCHKQGLIREVGVSNYGAKELRRVARDFEKRGIQLA
eukprot:GHRQ01033691.1.p1 GENE.GHRQ01033691.1~~GHRQ01033691.1.p1  ORF type:complete len:275 (+),score=117.78 GHRQ01033691.1:36-827(+)